MMNYFRRERAGWSSAVEFLSLAPKALDRPKRERDINIGYSCVITHRSIVLIGQSNFNGAGCSKDCRNDLARNAYRLLVRGANAAELTRRVHLALSVDGEFDSEAFENLSASRQWRPGTADT